MKTNKDKVGRILTIYSKLMNGCIISKEIEAQHYNVNERSIHRDINDIREFLKQEADEGKACYEIIYDRASKGYRLNKICQADDEV